MSDASDDERNPWRKSDGKPQSGPVEYIDRAHRRGRGSGGSLTWAQIGHSDDIVWWRPDLAGFGRRMGYR